MFQPPTVHATDAARKRFDQLVALYPDVKGEDAQKLYSDSLAVDQALLYALAGPDGLQAALNLLVERQSGLVQKAVEGQERLLAQFRRQAEDAQASDDPVTAGIHRDGAMLSLAVAKTVFRSATLTHETTQHILAVADITCLGVVALVEASDRHYESEAIKRFRSLVVGLVRDAVDPFEVVGSALECLVALSDVLRARVKDAKSADDVFARERAFQEMTHYAGLQVEQLTLMIRASLDASTAGAVPRTVSMEQAVEAWKRRLNDSNKVLGRSSSDAARDSRSLFGIDLTTSVDTTPPTTASHHSAATDAGHESPSQSRKASARKISAQTAMGLLLLVPIVAVATLLIARFTLDRPIGPSLLLDRSGIQTLLDIKGTGFDANATSPAEQLKGRNATERYASVREAALARVSTLTRSYKQFRAWGDAISITTIVVTFTISLCGAFAGIAISPSPTADELAAVGRSSRRMRVTILVLGAVSALLVALTSWVNSRSIERQSQSNEVVQLVAKADSEVRTALSPSEVEAIANALETTLLRL